MIALTGATGTIGWALLKELAELGQRPRLLLRPGGARLSRLRELGEPVAVDLAAPEPVPAGTLAGTRRLFLLTPLHPEQDRLQLRLIEAARRAGVRQVVKISALGADPGARSTIQRQHARADRALVNSGMSYALLRPNAFMQNARQWLATVRERGVIAMPAGDARVSMIDARDIAAVAARLLTGDETGATTFDLTGPAALSYPEMAECLSEVAGRAIRYLPVTAEQSAQVMRANGMPDWAVRARLELYATYRAGEAEAVTSDLPEQLGRLGRSPGTFGDYVTGLAHRLRA